MKLKGPHHRLWLGAMPKGVSSVNIWMPVPIQPYKNLSESDTAYTCICTYNMYIHTCIHTYICMHIYIYTYISWHAAPYPAWAGCLGSPKILR